MYASDAITFGLTIIAFLLALITSFFAYPEVSVLFILFGYYFSFYVLAVSIGMDNGWYHSALKMYFIVLVVTVIVFSIIYYRYGLISNGQKVDISFLNSVYFSITTWTTLGYGDFAPPSRIRHITSIQAILGYSGLGLLISLFNGYINNLATNRKKIMDSNHALIDKIKSQWNFVLFMH